MRKLLLTIFILSSVECLAQNAEFSRCRRADSVNRNIDQQHSSIKIYCGVTKVTVKPLFVVDGEILHADSLFKVDVNAIEKIDILKDSAARAIFGRSADNGVIIITTKFKKLKEVEVVAYGTRKLYCRTVCTSIIRGRTLYTDKVNTVLKVSDVSIYPNPVKRGNRFNVKISSFENIRQANIINFSGVLLSSTILNPVKGASTITLKCDSKLPSGPMILQLLDGNGKILSSEKMVVL